MNKLNVVTVVGTRPEIIRLSRIIPKLEQYDIEYGTLILSGGVHGQWNYEPWFSITMYQIDDFIQRVL